MEEKELTLEAVSEAKCSYSCLFDQLQVREIEQAKKKRKSLNNLNESGADAFIDGLSACLEEFEIMSLRIRVLMAEYKMGMMLSTYMEQQRKEKKDTKEQK